ncbi:MAG TPA: Glu/Leu/Phe/Val dehydrogenase dimerization domain-containing protein [Candidatus Eisenbacteria bacterium]|nr:Glu/Leu/Phe/Val dehydrogenase dimerization domain-containing protein [Candidatus Eisenbacteria bacterium]
MGLEIHASGASFDGFLVIDSVVHRTSSGGVRITPDLTIEEIRDLAHEMTLKYAWCGLPRGGAKSGLRMEHGLSPERRRGALEEFGQRLGPLVHAGLYYPGMDLGCSAEDLQSIYKGAGLVIGKPTDTSYFTALTVASSLGAWTDTHPGSGPCRLAIEGFGSVAQHLVSMLPENGFRVVAIATAAGAACRPEGFTPGELGRARAAHGDDLVHHLDGTRLPREAVAGAETDVFMPAARTRSLSAARADSLSARAVIPIANAPYAEGVSERLHARGIVCLPGYVPNCGGVFASSLHDSGVVRNEIERLFGPEYRRIVAKLLTVSGKLGRSPVELAAGVAERALVHRSRAHPSRWEVLGNRAGRRLPRAFRRQAAHRRCIASLRHLENELSGSARG